MRLLGLNGFRNRDLQQYGSQIRQTVQVDRDPGFGRHLRTKTLAKIANHYAKRYPGYHGCPFCSMTTGSKRL